MSAYWLAQGVGVIAFLIGITTFINRDSNPAFGLQRRYRRAFLPDGRKRQLNPYVRSLLCTRSCG
jgi:hypothetical protein